MKRTVKKTITAAAIIAAGCSACNLQAQSAEAILDKLVEKGVLTVKEANELREESDKGFTQAYSVKTGMPDWVKALKFNGDVRARYEAFASDAKVLKGSTLDDFSERNRFRYRMRFGVTATLFDNFEAGFKLTSSENKGSRGYGDPISGNTTIGDNGSKKLVYIDQAYGRWYAFNGPDVTGALTLGKMENPFVISDMVFDQDYTPEGAGLQLGYRIDDQHSLKLNAGGFLLNELSTGGGQGYGKDPYLVGAQARWDAAWSKKISTSAGVSWFDVENPTQLDSTLGAVPNVNSGNTRNGLGALVSRYNPVVVDASATYTLDSFPLYKGAFPIKVGGEYMNNPGAPDSSDNYAWNAGVTFGKSGKRGTWDLSYSYKWLGSDSWYEELTDSDFGALYQRAQTAPGIVAGVGYNSGTNVKGHVFRFAYSPTDALTLSVKWFLTDTIKQQDSIPVNTRGEISRLQVDASLKF